MKRLDKNNLKLILSIFLVLLNINFAKASDRIVAIIGQMSGSVLVTNKNNEVNKIKPYSQLSLGQTITVNENSKAQVIYKKSGIAEVWEQGKFTVGNQASEPIVGKPIEVSEVPPILQRQIDNLPSEIKNYNRAGMVRIRSISDFRLKEIDRVYKKLKSEQKAGQYYAEYYWLNSLYNEKAYEKLNKAINELKTEHPNDPGIEQLINKYSS